MKNLIAAFLAALAVTLTASAQNDTGVLTSGITFVTAGATSNALSTAWVEVKNHEEIAVQWKQWFSATNAPGSTLGTVTTFGGSIVPSNFVAIATVSTLSSGTDNTTSKTYGTNIYLGSYRYFAVMSQASTATNTVTSTNTSLSGTLGGINYIFKDRRNGIR
jgi:hypothetical protein